MGFLLQETPHGLLVPPKLERAAEPTSSVPLTQTQLLCSPPVPGLWGEEAEIPCAAHLCQQQSHSEPHQAKIPSLLLSKGCKHPALQERPGLPGGGRSWGWVSSN